MLIDEEPCGTSQFVRLFKVIVLNLHVIMTKPEIKFVDSCWIFLTKWSDTFRSFFCIWKGARILKKIS